MKFNGAAWLCVLVGSAVAACTNGGGLGSIGGGGGGGGSPSPLPTSSAIGVGIPTGKIGVANDPTWGTVSGYTQEQTSQVLSLPARREDHGDEPLDDDAPHTERSFCDERAAAEVAGIAQPIVLSQR